jgi:chromosome segregation ATPase
MPLSKRGRQDLDESQKQLDSALQREQQYSANLVQQTTTIEALQARVRALEWEAESSGSALRAAQSEAAEARAAARDSSDECGRVREELTGLRRKMDDYIEENKGLRRYILQLGTELERTSKQGIAQAAIAISRM